jgi:thiamine pyrophosphate-dependent acetolactate synthase large subunit-like protein
MIEALEVFKAFAPHRDDAVVIVSGTAGKHWRDVTDNTERDMNLGGAMGHTTSAAFGLAMGLPKEKVVLFDSEGALLMNLGVLASVAGKKPKNFVHFLMDNGCYATTGGQPVPNSEEINYAGIAREAGYAATYEFRDLEEFTTNVESIMKQEGPVFVAVKVVPEVENMPIGMRPRRPTRSRPETITAIRKELGITSVYGE